MENTNNELVIFESQAQNVFAKINGGSEEEKAKLIYNAINGTSKSIQEIKDKEINLKSFIAHQVNYRNDETGEIQQNLRCVLIDDEGNAYATTSKGIQSSLAKLFSAFGTPDTWEKPKTIKIYEKTNKRGFRFLTIELV